MRLVLLFAALAVLGRTQDLLTSVRTDAEAQWTAHSDRVIDALRLHAKGDEANALLALGSGQSDLIRRQYQIAAKRSKVAFWQAVVRGTAPDTDSCLNARRGVDTQIASDAGLASLQSASEAYTAQDNFKALADLLSAAPANAMAAYRVCFAIYSPDAVFGYVETVLGPAK